MPDRYGTPDDETPDPIATAAQAAEQARRAREIALEARHAELELESQERANCPLCDDAGYRNGIVCDHIDRSETHRRGIEACRAALAKENHR
ncbi:MAG: hypothetical protein M3Y90_15585 [Actinomycetota bacterium]|nr:hypothetical protein [Actinomycetota bacterium]